MFTSFGFVFICFSILEHGIFEGFKGIANKVVDVLNDVISALEGLVNRAINGINSLLSTLGASKLAEFVGFDGSIDNISFGRIPHFSTGGFPEDGLFYANHTELIGQFSNGRTVVANNEMIITGIEEAAYRGFSRAYTENDREVSLLKELIDAVREGKTISIQLRIRLLYKLKSNNYSELIVVNVADIWRESDVWYQGRSCQRTETEYEVRE